MPPNIQSPCAPIRKTGTMEGQGAGSTRNAAIVHATMGAYNMTALSLPTFPRCPNICPIQKVGPLEVGAFNITEEGEFDLNSPTGKIHRFYVKGTLEWSITRTCSKITISPLFAAGPRLSKPRRQRAKRARAR